MMCFYVFENYYVFYIYITFYFGIACHVFNNHLFPLPAMLDGTDTPYPTAWSSGVKLLILKWADVEEGYKGDVFRQVLASNKGNSAVACKHKPLRL